MAKKNSTKKRSCKSWNSLLLWDLISLGDNLVFDPLVNFLEKRRVMMRFCLFCFEERIPSEKSTVSKKGLNHLLKNVEMGCIDSILRMTKCLS